MGQSRVGLLFVAQDDGSLALFCAEVGLEEWRDVTHKDAVVDGPELEVVVADDDVWRCFWVDSATWSTGVDGRRAVA